MTDEPRQSPTNAASRMTSEQKLEVLLTRWEIEPNVMLFGAGANATGKVAAWIREQLTKSHQSEAEQINQEAGPHPGEQKPPSQTYATFGSDRVSMRSEKV